MPFNETTISIHGTYRLLLLVLPSLDFPTLSCVSRMAPLHMLPRGSLEARLVAMGSNRSSFRRSPRFDFCFRAFVSRSFASQQQQQLVRPLAPSQKRFWSNAAVACNWVAAIASNLAQSQTSFSPNTAGKDSLRVRESTNQPH